MTSRAPESTRADGVALQDCRFVCSSRVRFPELDSHGVVFYSRYLEYADSAIIEYWRDRDPNGRCRTRESGFQVKAAHAEYFRPLRDDEVYAAGVNIDKVGNSSVTFSVGIYGNEGRNVCCMTRIVQVNVALQTGVAIPLTAAAREALHRDLPT